MSRRQNLLWLLPTLLLICLLVVTPLTFAQTPQAPQPNDDVVRVFTELVQTDVMVFDKQGHFVNGLTRDNFEIKIDGKVRPIQFFEQIQAGTSNEEAQLAAARGASINTGPNPKKIVPLDRGRTVFFYVDDFHLDPSGFVASRRLISDFIDKEMAQNDQAAIASATGQIGFLQQLTDDHTVLHQAIERLNARTYRVRDGDSPPMGGYEAMMVDNNDFDLVEYFIRETIRANGGQMSRDQAASIVNARAHAIMAQDAAFSLNTLAGLENLIRVAKDLPGRKILFFLSDGFLVQNRRSDAVSRIQRITSAAAKSGVVIYAIDTQGLAPPKSTDASNAGGFDMTGVLARSASGEQYAVQDGLNALSRDTGGKPIFNTNDFKAGLRKALQETAVYYLLAWGPDAENKKPGRFRNIQVNVIGRPDLTVRVRKGFYDIEPPTATTADAKKAPTPSASPSATSGLDDHSKLIVSKLREAISAAYPMKAIPLTLGMNYYDMPIKGATLAASVQIPGEFLQFGPRNGKTQAVVDITGVFFDDKGQAKGNFYERLVTTAPSPEDSQNFHNDITYTYPTNLAAGLYQVRVAARDELSGRTGSAQGWIEIPDLTKGKLAMSSLLLGGRNQTAMTNISSGGEAGPVVLNASHRFRTDATLRFLVFGYNAKASDTDKKPDLTVQVQVIRDDQPVLTTALRKVNTDGLADLTRIPYAAEIPLSGFQPGRYILQVTFIDRLSKQSSSRQTHFDIY
jgi:VWFA-related protein